MLSIKVIDKKKLPYDYLKVKIQSKFTKILRFSKDNDVKRKKHLKILVMGLTTGRCIFFMSLMTKFSIISTKCYQKIKCRGFAFHYVD